MKPFDVWPHWADEATMREGWILTNDSGERVTIARLDAPGDIKELDFTEPKFENDQAANDAVAILAATGSSLHLLAVWLQGYLVDDELEVNPPVARQSE